MNPIRDFKEFSTVSIFRFGLFVLFYAHQDHGQIPVHEVVRESAHRLQDAISLEMGFFVLDAVGFELAFSEVLQSYLFNIVGIHFITSFLDFRAIYAIQCPNFTMKVHFFNNHLHTYIKKVRFFGTFRSHSIYLPIDTILPY